MESNSNRKGFVKGKLVMMSFYRATSKQQPHSSTAHSQFNTSKVKPSPLPSSMGYIVNQDHHLMNYTQTKQRIPPSNASFEHINVNQLDKHVKQRVVPPPPPPPSSTSTAAGSVEFIVNEEKVTPQPKQMVSILLQESSRESYANVDSLYGTFAADEGVDMKAASYISSVRERFRLQPMSSEHKKFQDMQH